MDCTAHSLQLPLRKVIDGDPELGELRHKVFSLLNKFAKSELATRSLREKCGLKLLFPGVTRWNSLCMTYDRLLEIRQSVDEVCIERNWATLGELYEKIEAVCGLLRPFLNFTNFLQGEKYPTTSSVIPTILSLLLEIESPEPIDRWRLLGDVPTLLAAEVRDRFSHVIGYQRTGASFDSTYLVATFLNPNTGYLLSKSEQKLARRELLIMMYKGDANEENSIDLSEPSPTPSSPFVSRFSRLARVATVTHRLEEMVESRTDGEEVKSYMSTFACVAPTVEINVVAFWKIH
uniref:Uncharacterized protein n=1 Tax=Plectus sambesii TaxID=2011161 RepID=A0A914VU13_9BILA